MFPPVGDGGLAWAECPGAGDYPVLGVDFVDSENSGWQRVLFDTGARYNYVSDQFLDKIGVAVDAKFFRRLKRDVGSSRADQDGLESYYREVSLEVSVSAGGDSHHGFASFRVVNDWMTSPFATSCSHGKCDGSERSMRNFNCGYRVGLMSARLLRELQVTAELDGYSRKLRIRAAGN